MFVLKSKYKKLEQKAADKDLTITEQARRISDLESKQRLIEHELLMLRQKYSPIIEIEAEKSAIEASLTSMKSEYNEKREFLDRLIEKVDFYSDDLYAHDLGIYELPEDLVSSGEYSLKLADCKTRIKKWVTDWKKRYEQSYFTSYDDFEWFFLPKEFTDDSKERFFTTDIHAVEMVRNNQMYFLHYFSYMMDDIIKRTNLANFSNQKKKIEIAAAHVRAFGTAIGGLYNNPVTRYTMWVESDYFLDDINRDYLTLKHEELELTHKLLQAKQLEKEKVKEAKDTEREQLKAQKEFEKALKQEEKYQEVLNERRRLLSEMHGEELSKLQSEIARLEEELARTIEEKNRAESMAQLTKSGYVYIISNVGSFGDGVVKIGMTRRVDPNDRVKELGDASVPFSFDTHALIYSEDAPALEGALHKRFSECRINKVNNKKEFFRANIEDVKQAVLELAENARFVTDTYSIEYFKSIHLASVNVKNERHLDVEVLPESI
jgi:hypothetical protein